VSDFSQCDYYLPLSYEIKFPLTLMVATVTCKANRSGWKLIHIVTSIVQDLDVVFPPTAVAIPEVTNFTGNYSFLDSWVFTI